MLILQLIPIQASSNLLVINADNEAPESQIIDKIKKCTKKYRIDSKNINQSGMNLIIEIYLKEGVQLVGEIKKIDGVRAVSFLYHEGEVKS